MRKIIFRGKIIETDIHDGQWISGVLMQDPYGGAKILYWDDSSARWYDENVSTDTVGQFTGMIDSVGIQIFEGDMYTTRKGTKRIVYWSEDETRFKVRSIEKFFDGEYHFDYSMPSNYDIHRLGVEVRGSIHDN